MLSACVIASIHRHEPLCWRGCFITVVNPVSMSEQGYYPHRGDKLGGRVTCLSPLLAALRKVCGDNSYLRFLDSFRYQPRQGFAVAMVADIRIRPVRVTVVCCRKCAAIILTVSLQVDVAD